MIQSQPGAQRSVNPAAKRSRRNALVTPHATAGYSMTRAGWQCMTFARCSPMSHMTPHGGPERSGTPRSAGPHSPRSFFYSDDSKKSSAPLLPPALPPPAPLQRLIQRPCKSSRHLQMMLQRPATSGSPTPDHRVCPLSASFLNAPRPYDDPPPSR